MAAKSFCSCNDLECENHPQNQSEGCDPCIKKNLQRGEIPACFFRLIDTDLSNVDQYTIRDFVEFYLAKQQ